MTVRGRGGKPTKLTPAVQAKIVEAIAAGNYLEAAAAAGGVDYPTVRRWILRGEKEPGPYREFRDAVAQAQAQAEVAVVAQWRAAIPDNWAAARDFLARRFPERWGARERQELSGAGGGPLQVVVEVVGLERTQVGSGG